MIVVAPVLDFLRRDDLERMHAELFLRARRDQNVLGRALADETVLDEGFEKHRQVEQDLGRGVERICAEAAPRGQGCTLVAGGFSRLGGLRGVGVLA